MHPIPARQRIRRQPLELPIPPDLLEQLHSTLEPIPSTTSDPRSKEHGPSGHARTEGGPNEAVAVGPTQAGELSTEAAIQIHYRASKVKQYFKEGRALRTETTINDTRDFGIGRIVNETN
ncbi:MAG TPA: hypothetical protein VEF89_07110, partial [Solirubrobacteraceae bacterium]|nr:hypothetical protein [Solirubrobacteraceae bacterium]